MKACKDCIHYGFCSDEKMTAIQSLGLDFCFKDKSKFVELPCCVGDTVWYIGWREDVLKCRVSMLQQKADKSWKVRISPPNSGVFDITLDEFGKRVFLTKEEAEKKLEEQNETQ